MDGGSRRKQARWRGGAAGQLGSSSLNAAAAGVAQPEREQPATPRGERRPALVVELYRSEVVIGLERFGLNARL